MTQQYQRQYYQRHKKRLNQRQKERRSQQRVERHAHLVAIDEPYREHPSPEVRSGYRPPDYEDDPDFAEYVEAQKSGFQHDMLKVAQVVERIWKTGVNAMREPDELPPPSSEVSNPDAEVSLELPSVTSMSAPLKMAKILHAELQRIALKYGLKPVSNEQMRRILPHKMKKPLLDIDGLLASRVVIEQD